MMPKTFLQVALFCLFSGVAFGASSTSVQTFYYNWYGNPETDGKWRQWDHPILSREGGRHKPPEDIGASFYPADGLYSSNDPVATERHMKQMKEAGIEVASVTWWGKGHFTDKALDVLFDAAAKHGIKVNFHIEPFGGRNAKTMREAIVYLLDKYGDHPALYRDPAMGNRTYFYLYVSYKVPIEEWRQLCTPEGAFTIRGTQYDAVMIGHWVKPRHGGELLKSGFDGYYTYFGADGFTYGSSPKNWPLIMRFAKKHNMLFVPCVAPGYEDLAIRPWNERNFHDRENGAYYDRMFQAALDCGARVVAITSWNEWHEGTQLEPAIPKKIPGYTYLDYQDREPDWYLKRTRYWADKLKKK